ncbi:MAG: hypothetical protein FWE41_03015 [Coriobacteriia bacterium]|nr:hypothetical protein [Coriobacteriia bacterium]MCL2750240.1 hypothetical protein [Coriobacteriia bacterium]
MRKTFAVFLAFMLAVSVLFSAAPAYADDSIFSDSTATIEQVQVFIPEADSAASDSADLSAGEGEAAANQDQQVLIDEDPSELSAPLANSAFEGSLLAAEDTSLAASASPLEIARAVIELNRSLNELLGILQKASGPSVVCIDSTTLSEDNLSASFAEGTYYLQTISLVNRINELLDVIGLSSGVYISSLPISVAGSLPEGFIFDGSTLTLVDKSLLNHSEELGDDPDALLRSYEVTLYLSTGSPYIDTWLMGSGVTTLAVETFTIDLLLILPSDVLDPDPGHSAGNEPNNPDPGTNPPPDGSNPPGTGGPPPGSGSTDDDEDGTGGGDEPNNTTAPSLPAPSIMTPELIIPAIELGIITALADSVEDPAAVVEDAVLPAITNIDDVAIPMASMMIDERGNLVITNASLVVLSMILALVALVTLRGGRSSGFKESLSAAQFGQMGLVMGAINIGLGLSSAILLVLSQYLELPFQNSGVAWTPVLIGIAIVQVACTLVLLISSRIAEKRAGPSRIKIRY